MALRISVRTLVLIALMAAGMVLSAAATFAATSDNASCKGQFFSSTVFEGTEGTEANKGEFVSGYVRENGGLQEAGETRSCNPNAAPQGGGETTAPEVT